MIGRNLNHYTILEKLGEGGMGVVYKARDTKLERDVAIKFLPKSTVNDPTARERFKIEARAAAALNHPNIATIFAIEEVRDEMFIVMELVEGEELREVIQKQGPLEIPTVLRYAEQIAGGLKEAHSKGIVHRDIKTGNLMVTPSGQIKIMDFGLARIGAGMQLTKDQTALGTVAFMSPEQTRGETTDHRTDIWSLGVVLYVMLTGELPFRGEYEQAVSYSVVNEDPVPVSSLRGDVPDHLYAAVAKALAKEPDERYQDLDQMILVLSGRGSTTGILAEPRPDSVRPVLVKYFARYGTIVGLVAALAVIWYSIGHFFDGNMSIAVADIVNETDEKELDGLSGMFITALEQSKRLSVVSQSRMFDVLKQKNQGQVDHIDEDLAREICDWTGANALLVATIRKFDALYSIDWKVIDPKTGASLFSTKEEDYGLENIPAMIDRLSEKTRRAFDENEGDLLAGSMSMTKIMPQNPQAGLHYALGQRLMYRSKYAEARLEFRKAVEADSTFALGYYGLAFAINSQFGDDVVDPRPRKKATAMIDALPEKERFFLLALNAGNSGGPAAAKKVFDELLEKQREAGGSFSIDKEIWWALGDMAYHAGNFTDAIGFLKNVIATDPLHEQALEHLSWAYNQTGQYDLMNDAIDRLAQVDKTAAHRAMAGHYASIGEHAAALKQYESVFQLDSTHVLTLYLLVYTSLNSRQYETAVKYGHKLLAIDSTRLGFMCLADAYTFAGDLNSALNMVNAGLRRYPMRRELLNRLGKINAFGGNYAAADLLFKSMISENAAFDVKSTGLQGQALVALYRGQYGKMMNLYDRIIDMAMSIGDSSAAASITGTKLDRMYWGYRNKDKVLKNNEIGSFRGVSNTEFKSLTALLYAVAGEAEKAREAVKLVKTVYLERRVETYVHHAKGRYKKAVEGYLELNRLVPRDRSRHSYMAAQCYLALNQPDLALAEVEKAQRFFGSGHELAYPLGFYLKGKIFEKKGDPKAAVVNYERFADLWKDADEDLPDLLDAKERLAALAH